MRAALALARRGEGRTLPNPAVGCVIVRDGRLLGRGTTGAGGRPHAETVALGEAGASAGGATAYVTLEPCCHEGRTPPCAAALAEAGLARVVVAVPDPDPRVSGGGIAMLEKAGLPVERGVLAGAVESFLAGYLRHRRTGLPFVTVKLATSLDGRSALSSGTSKWITGPESRRLVHLMRSRHDAVMTSASTVRADNPTLTCRLPGLEARQPLRVVVSTGLELGAAPAAGGNLLASLDAAPLLHLRSVPAGRKGAKPPAGVEQASIAADASGKPDLAAAMAELGRRGVATVMVEAGGRFAAALVRAGLVDRLVLMRSPGLIGNDGLPALAELGLDRLESGDTFTRESQFTLGRDTVEILGRSGSGA